MKSIVQLAVAVVMAGCGVQERASTIETEARVSDSEALRAGAAAFSPESGSFELVGYAPTGCYATPGGKLFWSNGAGASCEVPAAVSTWSGWSRSGSFDQDPAPNPYACDPNVSHRQGSHGLNAVHGTCQAQPHCESFAPFAPQTYADWDAKERVYFNNGQGQVCKLDPARVASACPNGVRKAPIRQGRSLSIGTNVTMPYAGSNPQSHLGATLVGACAGHAVAVDAVDYLTRPTVAFGPGGGEAERAFQGYYRSPTREELDYWGNQIVIGAQTAESLKAALDQDMSFRSEIKWAFELKLYRTPGEGDFTYWLARFWSGELNYNRLAALFEASLESKVGKAYALYFWRRANADDRTHWVGRLQSGVTEEALKDILLASPENVVAHTIWNGYGRPAQQGDMDVWRAAVAGGAETFDSLFRRFRNEPGVAEDVIRRAWREAEVREPTAAELSYWRPYVLEGTTTYASLRTLLFSNP